MAIVKIRVEGTREESALAVERLREIGNVREVSDFYANTRKGDSKLGRVYVDFEVGAR